MPIPTHNFEDGFDLSQWQSFIGGRTSPLAAYQEQLANRAKSKFSMPQNWIWTQRLLEQSSDEWVARMTAGCFPRSALVHDVCCGAGADSFALGVRGPVRALDASPIACLLCEANLDRNQIQDFLVTNNIAESLIVGRDDWVHIDPDRRSIGTIGSGNRTTNAEYFMPPLDIVLRLISESSGGSIKVAPTTQADEKSFSVFKAGSELFHRMGKQFVSWGSSVRQQRWWWNVDQFAPGTTTVSTMRTKDDWHHWTFGKSDSLFGQGFERIVDAVPEAAQFIGDTDPAVRAAGGQLTLAIERDCEILGSEQGYFFSAMRPIENDPLIKWFEVEQLLPMDRKKLKQFLHSRDVGVLEIKVRDAPIIPEVLRKELKLSGKESRTLLITRSAKKIIALIAKRLY